MMNEKGFIYPVLMTCIAIGLLIISQMAQLMIAEKQYYQQSRQLLVQDNLVRLAIKDLQEEIIQLEDIVSYSGVLYYKNGFVQYECTLPNEEIWEIRLNIIGEHDVLNKVIAHYSIQENKIVEWVEPI